MPYCFNGIQVSSDLNRRLPWVYRPFLTSVIIVFSFEIILATIDCFICEPITSKSYDTFFLSFVKHSTDFILVVLMSFRLTPF